MRKPVRFFTGQEDLALKGIVTEFNDSDTLGWWKEGSRCDAVGGQDSSTLPPAITTNMTLDIFISLMCRSIPIKYEKVSEKDLFQAPLLLHLRLLLLIKYLYFYKMYFAVARFFLLLLLLLLVVAQGAAVVDYPAASYDSSCCWLLFQEMLLLI